MKNTGKTNNVKANKGIKWKIFAYLLGFCVLLLLILWLFQIVFFESFYTSAKLSQIKKETYSYAELLENKDIDLLNEEVKQRGDVFLELFDKNGNMVGINGFFSWNNGHVLKEDEIANLWEQTELQGGMYTLRYDARFMPDIRGQKDMMHPKDKENIEYSVKAGEPGNENILCAYIVQLADETEILLVVHTKLSPVYSTVGILRMQFMLVSIIMLVLAVGIALLISRKVAKPIEQLNKTAIELGHGDYNVYFNGEGYREIEGLANTLNKTARELSKTEALRRDLIANVSHDLRTPLTLITGYAEMMRDIPEENNRENMQLIVDEAGRLSDFVEDLLDLSRLQSGTAEIKFEKTNITQKISGIIDNISNMSKAEGYTVIFEHENDVFVNTDDTRIIQVVYNFIANAMQYSGKSKKIIVKQEVENNIVTIKVVDEGPGIKEEDIPYVWEQYYRVEQSKSAVKGTGLGLSIAKSILEKHPNVKYGVKSGQGKGSVFWFSMPVL